MRTVMRQPHQQPDTLPSSRPATPPQPDGLLRLQRFAGNRAVTALLSAGRPASTLAVQRCGSTPADSCACHGNDTGGSATPMAQPYTGPETSDPV